MKGQQKVSGPSPAERRQYAVPQDQSGNTKSGVECKNSTPPDPISERNTNNPFIPTKPLLKKVHQLDIMGLRCRH